MRLLFSEFITLISSKNLHNNEILISSKIKFNIWIDQITFLPIIQKFPTLLLPVCKWMTKWKKFYIIDVKNLINVNPFINTAFLYNDKNNIFSIDHNWILWTFFLFACNFFKCNNGILLKKKKLLMNNKR